METLKTFIETLLMNCAHEEIGVQLGILLFGWTAIWFVGRPESWRRWGYILGLCSQPFWFLMLYRDRKCIVLAVSCLYAYSWAQGVWFYWIKPDAIAKNYFRRIKRRAAERGIRERELWAEIVGEYFQNHPIAVQKD